MVCYHPIRAVIKGVKPDGKKNLQFVKPQFDNYNPTTGEPLYEELLLPCGKCIGCLIKRSRDWANRMMLELKYHEKACFITLTYNDENVPTSGYFDTNGQACQSLTLRKKDYQDFMKRLRKHYQGTKIRFFACGEYGTKTHRPHYHAIIYGVDFSDDREILEITKDGFVQYVSDTLSKLWPFGYHMICDVTWQTCAYVARYVTKKVDLPNMYYQTFNIQKEFNLMSRRPGLARQYYEDNRDGIYEYQEIHLTLPNGGLTVSPPSYFDKLYDVDCPKEMESIRETRKKMAEDAQLLKLSGTSLNLWQMLEIEERNFKSRVKALKREGV